MTARLLLAIEASTTAGSVAIGTPDGVLAQVSLNGRGIHSSALVPAIDYAFKASGTDRKDLSAVVVGAGPGSFTGVRIAGATAKGIVHALGIPLLAYSSLLVAAVPYLHAGSAVCALFDARGRDVYAGVYKLNSNVETLVAPEATSLENAVELCRRHDVRLITGDAVLRHGTELSATTAAGVLPPQLAFPEAQALLWLAAAQPDAGQVPSSAHWEPDYLRASGAERIAAEKARTSGAR